MLAYNSMTRRGRILNSYSSSYIIDDSSFNISTRLSSSLNLIKRQQSNMKLYKPNFLKCNHNFYIEKNHFTISASSNNFYIPAVDNEIISQFENDITALKEQIALNEDKIQNIKKEYEKLLKENSKLKRFKKDILNNFSVNSSITSNSFEVISQPFTVATSVTNTIGNNYTYGNSNSFSNHYQTIETTKPETSSRNLSVTYDIGAISPISGSPSTPTHNVSTLGSHNGNFKLYLKKRVLSSNKPGTIKEKKLSLRESAKKLSISFYMRNLFNIHPSKDNTISVFHTGEKKFTFEEYMPNFSQKATDSFLVAYQSLGSSTLSVENGMYIVTGKNHDHFFYYDHNSLSIALLAKLPSSHKNGALIARKENDLFCVSGSKSNLVDHYNIKQNKWNAMPELRSVHCESSCFINAANCLFVCFGFDDNRNVYNSSIEFIDLNLNNPWTSVDVQLNIKLHTAFQKGESIFILGGCNDKEGNEGLYEIKNFKVYYYEEKEKSKEDVFLFRECFYEVKDEGNKLYASDVNGNVHSVDLETLRHKVFYLENK